MSMHEGRVSWRTNDLPFISYVYLRRPRVGIEWGDGLVIRIGRLYLACKIRWFR